MSLYATLTTLSSRRKALKTWHMASCSLLSLSSFKCTHHTHTFISSRFLDVPGKALEAPPTPHLTQSSAVLFLLGFVTRREIFASLPGGTRSPSVLFWCQIAEELNERTRKEGSKEGGLAGMADNGRKKMGRCSSSSSGWVVGT